MSLVYLILYILAWVGTVFYYQRKRCIVDAGSIILFSYLGYSVLSFFLYISTDFQSEFQELSLFPFVYLYLMLMLATLPVLNFDARSIQTIEGPHQNVIYIVSGIFIFFSLISIPSTIQHIGEGLTLIMLESSGGADLAEESRNAASSMGHGDLSNLPSVIASAFNTISIFLLFYLLAEDKKKTITILGLIVCIVISIFSSIASGSRGGPINIVLVIIATYFLFAYFYSNKINKWAKRIFIVFAILIFIPIAAITVSRFGEDNSSSSVLYYAGQENLYFNNYGLDDNGIRYGDRTIPLFKRMLGFSNVPHNYVERREMYSDLFINDEVFYTFVGDFTIDFGPITAFIIFLFFSIFFNLKTRIVDGVVQFRHLLLIHFVLCVCIQGGMTLFNFSDVGGNLKIICYFLVYLYSKATKTEVTYIKKSNN